MQPEIEETVNGDARHSRQSADARGVCENRRRLSESLPDERRKSPQKPDCQRERQYSAARRQFQIVVVRLMRNDFAGDVYIFGNGDFETAETDAAEPVFTNHFAARRPDVDSFISVFGALDLR